MSAAITTIQEEDLIPVSQDNTPNALLRLAVKSGADVDKLEKLMQLQERWQTGEARKAFYASMALFQAECPAIKKTKEVKGRDGRKMYDYAPLEVILDTIRVCESQHGFRHSWNQEDLADDKGIIIMCIISHRDGHTETSHVTIPSTKGMNTNASQDRGGMISYGKRYSLINAYGFAVGGEDNDCADISQERLINALEIDQLNNAMLVTATDPIKMLNYVESKMPKHEGVLLINDLTQSQFADCMVILKRKVGVK